MVLEEANATTLKQLCQGETLHGEAFLPQDIKFWTLSCFVAGIQIQYDITDDIIWQETACFAFTWQPYQISIKGPNYQLFKLSGELN